MLHWTLEEAFSDLLMCWREHERRRCLGNSIAVTQLAASRSALDDARTRVHLFRSAFHPDIEDSTPVRVHYCDSLDEIVHLFWHHRHPTQMGNLMCPCGTLLPIWT